MCRQDLQRGWLRRPASAMPKSKLGSIGADQDVAGLEIAMNHEVLVRIVNRFADGAKQ